MFFFFFKQKTAYEMLRSLVGSEMCIRDRCTVRTTSGRGSLASAPHINRRRGNMGLTLSRDGSRSRSPILTYNALSWVKAWMLAASSTVNPCNRDLFWAAMLAMKTTVSSELLASS
eukprot:TRINITY_DN10580_c0_g1_i5.p1 TRINITY_DN10580_c0_g1~~TRINITY_DN10580_c0_g1_i5.p1  ORF type:complete len:116 (-),score=23.21 TRINITY_DN10580_c0_g1_i5:160-507(-)